jgi:hypothetical protein
MSFTTVVCPNKAALVKAETYARMGIKVKIFTFPCRVPGCTCSSK